MSTPCNAVALYKQCMKEESPLSKIDREVVAVASSLTNSCTCVQSLCVDLHKHCKHC